MAIFPQITSPPQASAEVLLNSALQTLEDHAVYGLKQSTSTGLTWGYYGGRWGGFAVVDGTVTLTTATTNYVVVAIATGVVSTSTATTNWNDAANYVRVYKIVTGATTVTSWEDHRSGPKGVHGGAASAVALLDTDGTFAANSDTVAASQRAAKTYMDGKVAGLSWKQSVRAASTVNLAVATAVVNGAVVDGVTLVTGDRILLKNQTASAENGVYVVVASGAASRATDANTAALIRQASMYVEEGTIAADTQFVCVTNAPITLGTTALAFSLLQTGVTFVGGTLTSALNEAPTVSIASSATPAIGAAAGNTILLTGTTTVTGFDTIAAGTFRRVRFGGALLLTYNATSLILPSSANITTAVDDVAEFLSLGSGNWFCTSYTRKSGSSLVSSGSSPTTTKGDLAGYDTASARVPVGTDAYALLADSTQALGVKWGAVASVATPVGTAWDLTTASSNVAAQPAAFTFTNGNRTLQTAAGGTAYTALLKGTTAKTSGKLYFEFKLDACPALGTDVQIGLVSSSAVLSSNTWTALPAGNFDITFRDNGQIFQDRGGTYVGAFGAWSVGDVIGVAIDFAGATVKFYRNNTLQTTVSSYGGTSVSPYMDCEIAFTSTLRCLASQQTYAPPSGYSAWDAPASTVGTKGDLQGYSVTSSVVPVGTNGQVLTADSAQALGVKWASPLGLTNALTSAPVFL